MIKFKKLFNFNTLKSLTLKISSYVASGFSFFKFKMFILAFMFFYAIFLCIFGYFLYKSYLYLLECLKEYIYGNMSYDIYRLNYYHPIHTYVDRIPSVNYINLVYNKLGIIDYNDYIYGISSNTQVLHTVLAQNPDLQAKTSSIVLGDIIHQNAQLFGDLEEQLLKRLLRYSASLFVSLIVFTGLCVVENIKPAIIANICSSIAC